MEFPLVPTILLWSVTLIGLSVLGYIVNLRCDALLYARTVNGIRKYFSELSRLSIDDLNRILALPRSIQFPLYVEPTYFVFVVITFALVGTAYFVAGCYFYWTANNWPLDVSFWLLVGFCPWAHLFLYAWLGNHREREYLHGYIVGIDIDGVLNEHREHFSKILEIRTGKKLDAKLITRIPVREIPGGDVSESDEHAVFNWPSYWRDMPVAPNASTIIRKLRNLLGYRIWIFTYRGWPQPETFPRTRADEYWRSWREVSRWAILEKWGIVRKIESRLGERGLPGLVGGRLIQKITKEWLRKYEFQYDNMIVERGNTHTADPLILTRNRFLTSKERKIRVFVEDDLNNAKKLADICGVVFLIDHPYNQLDSSQLPVNVIRVKSWQDIYDFLRRAF
ncbi:hypothetical protein HY626_02250 [Candidatus Uhrbacteria bacterium]|nr:hypothetical protein [Candidatus Uhrbacteria bacterium]